MHFLVMFICVVNIHTKVDFYRTDLFIARNIIIENADIQVTRLGVYASGPPSPRTWTGAPRGGPEEV